MIAWLKPPEISLRLFPLRRSRFGVRRSFAALSLSGGKTSAKGKAARRESAILDQAESRALRANDKKRRRIAAVQRRFASERQKSCHKLEAR